MEIMLLFKYRCNPNSRSRFFAFQTLALYIIEVDLRQTALRTLEWLNISLFINHLSDNLLMTYVQLSPCTYETLTQLELWTKPAYHRKSLLEIWHHSFSLQPCKTVPVGCSAKTKWTKQLEVTSNEYSLVKMDHESLCTIFTTDKAQPDLENPQVCPT